MTPPPHNQNGAAHDQTSNAKMSGLRCAILHGLGWSGWRIGSWVNSGLVHTIPHVTSGE